MKATICVIVAGICCRTAMRSGTVLINASALLALILATSSAAPSAETGTLTVRIFDSDGKTIVPARVNVIGADNAFYQGAAVNPLAEYNFNRKGNRSNVGPLRYAGSFFYTDGNFTVKMTPGLARVEVSKGYVYYRSVVEANVAPGKIKKLDVVLRRMVDGRRSGWTSVDTHLHFNRGEPADDHVIAALLAAEGVDAGYIMTDRSAHGYGEVSTYSERGVSIASGQEIVNPALGHINVLMANSRIPALPEQGAPGGAASRTSSPLGEIYDRVFAAQGAMQHDHGGYDEEIVADVVLGKSDWVELLQFGSYRPKIGLEGYYQLLNCGFRYPLAGGSDYPVCRTLSDSVTYVAEDPDANLRSTVGHLLKGEDFASSGPLLFLSVDGHGPGSDIEFTGTAPRAVDVRVKAVSAYLPFNEVEIVQDGETVAAWRDSKPAFQRELKARLTVTSSTWIAARCSGPETAHAHTSPVWIYVNGRAPFHSPAARELLKRVQTFVRSHASPEAAKILDSARIKLEGIIRQDSAPARPEPGYEQRFPVGGADAATLFPVVADRPATRQVSVEGMIFDAAGHAVAQALVSANGVEPMARTDARGHFLLRNIALDRALFLRVSKAGYVTTNSSYLNPRTAKENLRILLLGEKDLQNLLAAWGRRLAVALPDEASRAIVLLNSAGANGKPLAGLSVTASPGVPAARGQPAFPQVGYMDSNGSFSAPASVANPGGPIQMMAVTRIELQNALPSESNPREANFIVNVRRLQKDMVIPAFPGQIGYALVLDQSEYLEVTQGLILLFFNDIIPKKSNFPLRMVQNAFRPEGACKP